MDNILDTLVKYNNQTQGRDKVFRLFQYGSRFLWWFAEKCRYDKDTISKLKNLEYSLSTARKLLRLGRSLDTIYGALKLIHLPDLILRILLTMAKINQGLYLLMDHVVWFGRVGLADINKDRWGTRANKFWLFSILLHFIRDIYELWYLISLEMRVRSHCGVSPNISPSGNYCDASTRSSMGSSLHEDIFSTFGPVSRWALTHKDVVLDTLKNGCDLVIPMTGLGYINVAPGVVGLCGVISSVIGMVTLVDPLARILPS